MINATGFGAQAADLPLAEMTFQRRDMDDHDLLLDILYCGVCHSDIHSCRNEWGNTHFPLVPGHEIVGRVRSVGAKVRHFKVGDLAAVGCFVDACGQCQPCQEGEDHYCKGGITLTYGSPERKAPNILSQGGFSNNYVVDARYALQVPDNLDPKGVAPLLCAGITTYSPLRRWQVGPGMRVGVVGLGGLGHMAIKFARAFGAEVTLFTTSTAKADDALRLGANKVVLSTDKAAMRSTRGLDFILDTVSAKHDIDALLGTLRRAGTLCLVGLPDQPLNLMSRSVLSNKAVSGSIIGSIAETREMLNFCAEKGIVADIELIRPDQINEAFDRVVSGDVKYRFVIDMAG